MKTTLVSADTGSYPQRVQLLSVDLHCGRGPPQTPSGPNDLPEVCPRVPAQEEAHREGRPREIHWQVPHSGQPGASALSHSLKYWIFSGPGIIFYIQNVNSKWILTTLYVLLHCNIYVYYANV